MKYKTSAEVKHGELVLIDGLLREIGDSIIAYHALLEAVHAHKLQRGRDFKVESIGNGAFYDRLKVTFSEEVTPAVVKTIENAYPGLVIVGKEPQIEKSVDTSYKR
ncbi:hypothetical protein [Legionella micdadei]|uniref:Uncharacterized protein n=1 Tax=Legionella micdadei TaxID=451 RepID=A0A098GHJ1_LEGMI|nr:hypothetical protein [Legionella micdadei]ARG96674.1 hypothetical protein B6N58_02730 [Legionella micdadei]ARG99420.1 hypothetical protein B6V88_02720 [Legionella micdadei]KTD26336.1 hypothetical protein Lmic_2430 [Legionella micdadei]NSL19088.1 hypothetical protein [Legionella micdadei]CEG61953.1 protein of unknown function [Legionella micdadei]